MKGPRLLAGVGLGLLFLTAAIGTPADADLWGHVTFGRDILASGHIKQADRYSFTSDRPWVNHEWLSEVSFAEAYRLAGPAGLVAVKLIVIAALLAVIWRHARRLRAPAPIAIALLAMAFVGTFWRTHTVRPQLFSVLCFATLLVILVRAEQGRLRGLLVLPLLMAAWVNLHGGWIVGLGMLGVWTAVQIMRPSIPAAARLMIAAAGLATVLATLANPHGVQLWTFLGETVRLGRDDIEEWGSVLTHPIAIGVPWIVTLIAAGLSFWRFPRARRFEYACIIGLLAFASFRVSRLDAFFALAVVVLLTPELVSLLTRGRDSFPLQLRGNDSRPPVGMTVITIVTVAAMLVPAARIIGPYATCLTIAGPWVPEREAGEFITLNKLSGRMLTWFDWGEYAIWHFGPNVQVSIDGRRETVYSDQVVQAHRRFYAADATALSYLNTLNPDYIWLPKRVPVASRVAEAGWQMVFSGPTSIVWAHAGAGPFQRADAPPAGMRCFPDQ
ncbi:MAG TPA: hypothetical protein VFV78_11715 [Vicinamibacterales bacterium]|nr:hypothetical protein [Vicinamibacterales bacterium]